MPSKKSDFEKKDYEVGKGKPPKEYQVKPGQRLRGAGRPKGARNKKTTAQRMLDIANEPLTLRVGSGRATKEISPEVAFRRLRNMAVSKDDKSIIIAFLDRYERLEKVVASTTVQIYPFNETDRQMIQDMYDRMRLCETDDDE